MGFQRDAFQNDAFQLAGLAPPEPASRSSSGLWLYDKAGEALAVLREISVVATRRFREHSELSARAALEEMPGTPYATNYDALAAAYFARVAGMDEVYLVENLRLVTTPTEEYVEVADARDASALLHTRTIEGTKDWEDQTAGAMIADLMDDLTGDRALPISFGDGIDIGSAFSLQRSWGDMGEVALEILSAQALGKRTRFEGQQVKLDVVAAADTDVTLGEKYGDGSAQRLLRDDREWRNYAYVLGEGEGSERVQVIVDQTSGAERRELYVDASDLQQGSMTLAKYQAQLAARGAAKLAETRRIEHMECDEVTAPLDPGDIVWAASERWAQSYLVTEVTTAIENGEAKHSVSLGDPPPTLKRTIRRLL